MPVQTIHLTPRIGTEIKTARKALLSGAHAAEIRALLEERGVLVFRELNLDDDEQRAFSLTLGDLIPQGEKGIYKITLDQRLNDTADYLKGTFYWHIDGTMDDIPTLASILTARRLSKFGGQTEFCNTYASYEELGDSEKAFLDKLRVTHSLMAVLRTVNPNPTEAEKKRHSERTPKTHPLVWTHKSGRKSLVLGLTADYVVGMDPAESRALIERLQAWATQPKYTYRHHWTMGDLIVWDNTGVMHRVEPYPLDSDRLLHRTTLVGEEALV